MSNQQITHEYLIYNHGTYLGKLQNVTSEFNLNETINSAGAQLQITVGQSADIANLPISPILDENGTTITDENGNPILPERQEDLVGSNNFNILIQNDNDVYVYEYSKDNPTGVCVFQGYISKWKATFGKTDDILITCLSNGQDLSNYLVIAPDIIIDQKQTNGAGSLTYGNDAICFNNGVIWPVAQSFVVGTGVTQLSGVKLSMAAALVSSVTAIVEIWSGSPVVNSQSISGSLLTSASVLLTSQTAQVIEVLFPSTITVTPGNTYTIKIYTSTWSSAIAVSGDASNSYTPADAYIYNSGNNGQWQIATTTNMGGSGSSPGAFYFETFYGTFDTTGGYTNTDVSTVFDDIMTTYNSQGGIMQIPAGGYALSGQLATYTFKSQTLLQGIQTCQSQLAPPDWWWYAEPSNSIVYFQESSTTPDFILIKGRHIDDVEIEATKETIKNDVYFTGGDDGTGTGTNIFVHKTDVTSIAKNRRGLAVISDNRVNSTSGGTTTADLIAQNEIDYNNSETYITTITLDNSTIDTTQLKIGKMIGFAGFGNFVDSLVLQIVGRNRNPLQTTLTVGTLPARVTKQIKDIQSALAYLQTVDNPSSAS